MAVVVGGKGEKHFKISQEALYANTKCSYWHSYDSLFWSCLFTMFIVSWQSGWCCQAREINARDQYGLGNSFQNFSSNFNTCKFHFSKSVLFCWHGEQNSTLWKYEKQSPWGVWSVEYQQPLHFFNLGKWQDFTQRGCLLYSLKVW